MLELDVKSVNYRNCPQRQSQNNLIADANFDAILVQTYFIFNKIGFDQFKKLCLVL